MIASNETDQCNQAIGTGCYIRLCEYLKYIAKYNSKQHCTHKRAQEAPKYMTTYSSR